MASRLHFVWEEGQLRVCHDLANVKPSYLCHGILLYGMILTTLFRTCHIDLSTEIIVRMPKPSDAIDNACIARLGYEYINGQWLKKGAYVPIALNDEIDEEAEMDVPPP